MSNGRLYTCPIIPYVKYFNKAFGQNLRECEEDSIDINEVNSYEELAEFVTHRVPFCRYCNVRNRSVHDWKQSDHSIWEYIDGAES